VANGEIGSPRKVSASASPSLVESNEASLVAASLGACRFESGGEAGGSAALDGVDSELESDRGFRAGAGVLVVPAGSFVLLEMSVSELATASEGSAPEASVGVAEGSVAVTPSDVSVPAAGAHVSVVSAAAVEVSVVPAEVSDVSVALAAVVHTSVAHASVVSAAATEVSVVPAEVSVACVASVAPAVVVHASVVSVAAAESPVVVDEVSVASGAVVHASVVRAAAPGSSVVVAEVSVASGAVVHAPVVSAVLEVSVVESDDVAGASETDGEGFSARAVAANRDAPRRAASTATVQPTNPRTRRRSKRGDRMLGTATELPFISASSPWRARCSSFEYCT
jgi:hypothetical protein